ncbi:MAG: MFS transporter [Verrucomicrobia bacterium]|nr:MFS transporter [Verrucomicrobiota bacterium]MBS0646699.1 MFS transporter [Verrucomicrobiota bacterium]
MKLPLFLSQRSFWSTFLGNLFEHYDTALFSLLSPYLAPLIFPNHDPLTALILTYGMIPLGMLARPIGALVFGYIGDVYGRQQALFLTLAGMSLISVIIALSPTYQQIGIWAPIIFCLGRVFQNFLSSGESMGGAVFILEHTQEKKHDLLGSLYSSSTLGGILLASAALSLFSFFWQIEQIWRWFYVLGCSTAIFGCSLRYQQLPKNKERLSFQPLSFFKGLWMYKKAVLLIAMVAGFSYASYSVALVLTNGFIPLVTNITKIQMLHLNTILLILDFCSLPFFGWLCSKIQREKMMLLASTTIMISSIPLFFLLNQASFCLVIIIRIFFVLLGVAFFAPFHAWAQRLVPAEYRYRVISFGYALGSQVFGGPTSSLSLWFFKNTNRIESIGYYWFVLACLTTYVLNYTLKNKTILSEKSS